MRGQTTIEFLLAFLAIALAIHFLVNGQEQNLERVDRLMNRTGTKMELDSIASFCDLVYFIGDNTNLSRQFNLPGYWISNRTVFSKSTDSNLSSDCLSEVGGVSGLEMEAVKKWF